jgi:hypothetical protein
MSCTCTVPVPVRYTRALQTANDRRADIELVSKLHTVQYRVKNVLLRARAQHCMYSHVLLLYSQNSAVRIFVIKNVR